MLLSELIEIPEELPVTAQIPLSEVIKEKANLSADIADWVRLEHPAAPADQNVGGWCALYAGCMNERFPSGHVADCLAALRQASGTSTGEALTALRQERTELEAEEAERLASTCDRLRGLEASFVEGIQQLDAAKDEHTKLIDQYDRLLDMVDSEDGYASVHATLTAASREKEWATGSVLTQIPTFPTAIRGGVLGASGSGRGRGHHRANVRGLPIRVGAVERASIGYSGDLLPRVAFASCSSDYHVRQAPVC